VGTDPDLRILILSTPKTGNTWLRHLLAGVYRLPQFYVPPPLDCAKLDKAGERWVTHYHTRPNRELLSWIRTNRAVVVTTIRHPGDVLLSLYHHVHEFRNETIDQDFLRRMLSTGFERRGMTTYAADQPFSADLDCSLEWMACEGTHTVRFEDLRADPVAALRELTSRIHPAPLERIEAAVEMCDIDVMRRMAGDFSASSARGASEIGAQRCRPTLWKSFAAASVCGPDGQARLLHGSGDARRRPMPRSATATSHDHVGPLRERRRGGAYSWSNAFSGLVANSAKPGRSSSLRPVRAASTTG
jgi:hypothetical protein